jgi:WhiB family redox-sensing transcriptional regulator
MNQAACHDMDPRDFIVDRGKPTAPAKRVCAQCPVRSDCRDFAKETGSVGIWGGEMQDGVKEEEVIRPLQDARPQRVQPVAARTRSTAPSSPRRIAAANAIVSSNY